MFLLNTLTVPKIKDLVNKPNQQYKDIFETLHTIKPDTKPTAHGSTAHGSTAHAIPAQIADELTSFLSDLKKTTVGTNGSANGVGTNGVGTNGVANGMANNIGPNNMGAKNATIIGTSDIDSLGYSLF
jgi:hypothetical protein